MEYMDVYNRRKIILNTIIKEHIRTGAPVGSSVLVEKYKLNISPATVRNEMASLEEEGMIEQPHISSGRIPTEKAYRDYANELKIKDLSSTDKKILNNLLQIKNIPDFKQTAKEMAKISNNAIFWAFHKHNLFYTGISNLLSQPEFFQNNLIYDISAIIDRLDETIDIIFDDIKIGQEIMIGVDNPFSELCSTIMVKYKSGGKIGLLGILGPIRMNYEKNLALINHVFNELKK